MSDVLSLRGFPIGGSQLAHQVDGPLTELGKHVPEIVPQINIQPAASLHDGGNGCDLGTSLGAADVQPILAAQRQRSNGSFTPVVVDLDPAIAQILFQPTPLFQGVITG